MPNYKEETLTGSQWQRCNSILIENNYGATPKISMSEETITVVGNNAYSTPAGILQFNFASDEEIQIIDVVNDTFTGKVVTFAELYATLRSLYNAKAKARDAAIIQAAADAKDEADRSAAYNLAELERIATNKAIDDQIAVEAETQRVAALETQRLAELSATQT
jgi:hypothetical protein